MGTCTPPPRRVPSPRQLLPLQYEALFAVSKEDMQQIKEEMVKQMELGLQGKEGGLMMLPSFVDVLPSG